MMRTLGPRRPSHSRQKVPFIPPDQADSALQTEPDAPPPAKEAPAETAAPADPPKPAPPRYNAYKDAVDRHQKAMERIAKAQAESEKKDK